MVLGGLAEPLNGVDILEDLACCLIEGLRGNCDLRASDAYWSYAARITVELFLNDLGVQKVDSSLVIGKPNAAKSPDYVAAVEIPDTSAEVVRERSGRTEASMEVPVAGTPLPEKKGGGITLRDNGRLRNECRRTDKEGRFTDDPIHQNRETSGGRFHWLDPQSLRRRPASLASYLLSQPSA
jgi:hypothetical protein